MSNKTWVAMTGVCVLMATSAAQAHLIPICVEAYESGTEVAGAVAGVTRSFVTFTEAGAQAKPLAAVDSETAMPYWRASSAPNGCVSQTDATDSTGQRTASQGVGPGAGLLLAPVAGLVPGSETSLDPATNIAGLDSTDQSQSSWSFDGAANRRALLASTSTFGQSFGGYGMRLIAPGADSGRAPLNTSEQGAGASGAQSSRPSAASGNSQASSGAGNNNGHSGNVGQGSSNGGGNIGNAPVDNGAAGTVPSGNGAIGNEGNGNISPVPAGGHGGGSGVGVIGNNPPATQVPEPETLALMMMGVIGIAISRRRRREPARTA